MDEPSCCCQTFWGRILVLSLANFIIKGCPVLWTSLRRHGLSEENSDDGGLDSVMNWNVFPKFMYWCSNPPYTSDYDCFWCRAFKEAIKTKWSLMGLNTICLVSFWEERKTLRMHANKEEAMWEHSKKTPSACQGERP